MNTIRFKVEGIPRPKQSFKYRNGGGYTPPLTRAWQDMVTARAKEAMALHGWDKIEGPVHLILEFCLLSSKRMDVDNLAKCVSDGLRHVCFTDDNQVTYLEVSKGIVFDWTGVRVTVEPTDCGRELFSK